MVNDGLSGRDRSSHPTLEWSALQDVYYRKSEIYQLTWGIDDLSDYIVASAKNGGLLALVRDPTKLVTLGRASLLKPKINVYTSAGQLIESIPWDASDKIVAIGFNSLEQLAVVLEEGVVRLYTLLSPCPSSQSSPYTLSSSAASSSSAAARAAPDDLSASGTRPIEATSTCYYVPYSLGREALDTGIVDAQIWEHGLVALTTAGVYVQWQFPKRRYDDECALDGDSQHLDAANFPQVIGSLSSSSGSGSSGGSSSSNRPFAWHVLPANVSSSGLVEVLISPASSNTIFTLESVSGPTDMRLSRGPFAAIRASPNGKLLALITADNKLWVVSLDFQRSLSEFDLATCKGFSDAQRAKAADSSGSSSSSSSHGIKGTGVRQVEWCGDNTVVLAWHSEVLMIGPFGDSLSFPYYGPIHLISELDGMRIVSADRLEFLQKVPECSSQIFLPGSSHAAAILFDSSEQFSKKSAKADEGVRAIEADLAMAVDTCLAAATYEFRASWQQRLLRAASFGKAFLDVYDPTNFVETARTLRVLNAARWNDIGVPITFEQYSHMGPTALLARLTARNHHLLCLRISSFLELRPDAILKHWARAKIARSKPSSVAALAHAASARQDDDEICDAIVKKFEMQPAASFAEIAKTAWNAGRTRLATKLLDHEPRAVDQVPLLLSMREDKLALVKALESGDTDLVYHVVLRLKAQLSRGDFFRIIQAPAADASAPASAQASLDGNATAGEGSPLRTSHLYLSSRLLESYALSQDRELLRDFYYQDDRRTESAMLSLHEAELEQETSEKVFKIKEAMRLFGEDKDRGLESKLCDEYAKLLGFQLALEKEDSSSRSSFVGLSINETIRQCLIKNMAKKAEKLRSDFKVPDRRFWSIKVSSLVAANDIEGLWAFAGSKKSPIGYTPFVSALIEQGFNKAALEYVAKCASDRADRAKLSALIQRLPAQVGQPLADKLAEL